MEHALMKGESIKTTLNENMIFGQKYSNSLGLGRYDLAIEPKDKNRTGYIFEFKIAKPQKSEGKMKKEMDRLGKEALEQIEG